MLTLDNHRALEFATGVALAAVPLALAATGMISPSPAAIVIVVAIGAVLITLGISADRAGRSIGGSAHAGADRVLAGATIVMAVTLAIAAKSVLALLCLGGGAMQILLALTTSYAEQPRGLAGSQRP